jgi:SAM-dependent methyltransferase
MPEKTAGHIHSFPVDVGFGGAPMSVKDEDTEHWSRVAADWTAWARAPNHDEFWAYRASLLAFIGQGAGDALDVGCGEGRVSRVLKECGYRVTAINPVEQLIVAAEQAGSADTYRVAAAADLPFEDCCFDLVLIYNVLMNVEDVPAALREVRRVLRPSGTLVISICHPFADRGRFAGPEADSPFVLQKSYFGRERFEGTDARNGLQMHFAGWSQPLESYMAALESADLAVTSLREPVPDADIIGSHVERWSKVPLYLWLKARLLTPDH